MSCRRTAVGHRPTALFASLIMPRHVGRGCLAPPTDRGCLATPGILDPVRSARPVLVARSAFADEANAGHFFDRLPHILDFLSWLIPKDWNDVWRALFDMPRHMIPATEGIQLPLGRVYICGRFLHSRIFRPDADHGQRRAAVDVHRLRRRRFALLHRGPQTDAATGCCRWSPSRIMEICAPSPRSSSPACSRPSSRSVRSPPSSRSACIPIGALGKLFYEVIENIDMRAERRPRGGRRQLVRAGALRHHAAGHAQFHLLRAPSAGDQRPRLDDHRRRRRRRHRRRS